MPLEILRQGTFTSGELDPKLVGRRDLKAYASGLAVQENCLSRPQGEIVRRGGLAFVSRVRTKLQALDWVGATLSSPYPGPLDVYNVMGIGDGQKFRTNYVMGFANPYVACEIDFGAAREVSVVDINDYVALGIAATTPGAPGTNYPWSAANTALATIRQALKVQYYNDANVWTDFGVGQDLGTVLRTRRVALAPGVSVTARRWRILKVGAVNFLDNVIEIESLQFLRETGVLSAARDWRFTFDNDTQQYQVVVTEGHADVFRHDDRVGAFRVPYSEAQILAVRRAAQLDTLLTFHPDVQPQRITRQGSHDQWDIRVATFKNVPLYDFDGTNLGAVDEQQDIKFKDYANGDTFTLTYEGEETTTITYITTDPTAMANNVKAALEDLPSIGADNISVTGPSANVYRVEFVNQMGGGDVSNLAGRTVVSDHGIVYIDSYLRGKEGGEAMMSVTRGWPACGCFYQERLFLGGLKLRPQTILASRLGEFFDFDTRGAKADAAISVGVGVDVKVTIGSFFPGQHLQIFTDGMEFFFPTEPIIPPSPAIKRATTRGLRPGTPMFEMDEATIFVTSDGNALADFDYSYDKQNYVAPSFSAYWSHIVSDIVDIGYRRASNTSDPDLALCVRADGGAALMWAMVSEEVVGFANFTTDGLIKAATGEAKGDIYVVVQRMRGASPVMTFERLDDTRMLDSSVFVTGAVSTVGGLDHLEGRTVMTYIDGGYGGDVVVTAGVATLPYPSLRTVEIGLWFKPTGRTMPGVLEDPRGGSTSQPRVGTAEFDLGPTATLRAGMVGGRMWEVPLRRRPDALLDQGPGENPFDGWTKLEHMPGFRSDAQIEFTQTIPGPFCIRQIVVAVST